MIRIRSGRQLWALREPWAGRSIDWLAEATGITAERIALFEAGREPLPDRLVAKCVAALTKDVMQRLAIVEQILGEPETTRSPTGCCLSPSRIESVGLETW